jgi:hypothetical protein
MTALVRCGGCAKPPPDGTVLRRGRCITCYEAWVRARPVGQGANCAACNDRRRVHLRHYELGLRTNSKDGRWVILCHNCAAAADSIKPPPRSIEGLKMRLQRDRRWAEWSDRRQEERTDGTDRRMVYDATHLAEEVIEMIADYEEISPEDLADIGEVTGIHHKIP